MPKSDPLVRDIQARLRDRGVAIKVDGVIGPKTLAAVLDALGGPVAALTDAPAPGAALHPGPGAVTLITEFEGCHKRIGGDLVEAYPDPATGGAPWTIGWGSTGPDIGPDTLWTQAQADARLEQHLAEFGAQVAKLIGDAPTTQHQFDAMVSLAYNVGAGNLASSTLLKKHKAGDYAAAATEFGRWNKAAGKVLPGLTRRRAAEARFYQGQA